jgi:membrane protease subunit (stomatin/prohibitin family)
MGQNNIVFLEVIEWLDTTGNQFVQRIPSEGSGEIKFGAQLLVRESQSAIFFYNGRAIHVFGVGRHTLKTANIPILNKIMSIPWGITSPLRAEVYFINMKTFTNQKWGTKDPVAFKDSKLGLIRLRAHGQFNIRIVQPLLFINSLVGTLSEFTTDNISDYFSSVIVSRFNDYLGDNLDTIYNLPGKYDNISDGLINQLKNDFAHFGVALTHLYINSITTPLEVQKAIDDKSRLAIFDNLDDLVKMKAAMALEKASENPSGNSNGIALGLGLMVPNMLSRNFSLEQKENTSTIQCMECGMQIPKDSKFCCYCGHQVIIFSQCEKCGKNLPPFAKYCPRCGAMITSQKQKKKCSHCGYINLENSIFCNQCGERL